MVTSYQDFSHPIAKALNASQLSSEMLQQIASLARKPQLIYHI